MSVPIASAMRHRIPPVCPPQPPPRPLRFAHPLPSPAANSVPQASHARTTMAGGRRKLLIANMLRVSKEGDFDGYSYTVPRACFTK